MRRLIILGMATLLVGCATSYRRPILGMGGGYSDKQVGEGTWKVTFGTNAYTPRGYALNAAIYRSAELARNAGFPYFQVVRSSLVIGSFSIGYGYASPVGNHYGGEGVYLTVRGVQSPDDELKCENDKGAGCMTLSTEEVLREIEPVVRSRRSRTQNEINPE